MARRLLVLWLPRFASDLWLRRKPVDAPFALISRAGNAERIHCLNPQALQAGLRRDMPLADARAIFPDLVTAPFMAAHMQDGLRKLRRWTMRYAPQVALDAPDGLVADITGVAHLFGGEAELRDDLEARLERAGFACQTAIAPTRGAAWALSRHGGGIIGEGALQAMLSPLPLSSLRYEPKVIEGLTQMGLRLVGDLIPLPRAPLARRFGLALLHRLDQALGTYPEPVGAVAEAEHFGVRLTLPEPIGRSEDVMEGVRRLLGSLCHKLARAQMGARRLRLELHRVDRETIRLEIGLARPMRDADRMAALFVKHVEAADAGFGIEGLRLQAQMVEPLGPAQIGTAKVAQDEALQDLTSTLGNHLGFERIVQAVRMDSAIPELQFQWQPAPVSPRKDMPPAFGPPRPVSIFPPEWLISSSGNPPLRFRWRGMEFTTLRAHGPERICPNWWETTAGWERGLRDYWRIETGEGPRLWLFHTPQSPAWAVQGEFL